MRKAPRSERMVIHGPAGALEALLEEPSSEEPRGIAVICHPHPVHGGTMHNKVAHTLARAFLACGFAALRFNFRGVGDSEGSFDEGVGEIQDALAAAQWSRQRLAGPQWLAGFSFGAAIAIRVAGDIAVDGLITVAPAVSRVAQAANGQPICPWLVIQGADDELVDPDDTITWLNGLEPGPELEMMPGTGHFFHGRLVKLRETVERFVTEQHHRRQ